MSLKAVVNVKCPCCGEVLEIDVAKERVIAHRKGPHLKDDLRQGEDVLDVARRNEHAAAERAKDDFTAATKRVKNSSSELDRLFKEAQKKVKDKGADFDDSEITKRWD